MKNKLNLDINSQEKHLLSLEVDSVTVETTEGEITILPNHSPLLSRLSEGFLAYRTDSKESYVAIFGGFIEVTKSGTVNVLADSAIRAENIDIERVESAKKDAEEALQNIESEQDLIMAEAALKKASLELKVAHKFKRSPSTAIR